MYRGKKHIFLVIIIGIVVLYCSLNIYTTVRKNGYIKQIESIIVDCVKNDIDNKYISIENGQKIYNSIQDNWEEDENVKIEAVNCNCEDENWDEQYVCVMVEYKGVLGNGEEIQECEYYKIYFKTEDGEVYILKVGVSVGETGTYDLDT